MQATSTSRFAESMSELRFMCISQVLGTDMKKHFDISSRFQVGLLWLYNTSGCASPVNGVYMSTGRADISSCCM